MINNKLFKGKYRIDSPRLKGWDYSSPGGYMVTICTQKRGDVLGRMVNHKVCLNALGEKIGEIWEMIPKQFMWCGLDEWIVMPDHVHGIIMIDEHDRRDGIHPVSNTGDAHSANTSANNDSPACVRDTINGASTGIVSAEDNPMIKESLSTIIRWFKGRVTYEIRKELDLSFRWQGGFHDRIIHDVQALDEMRAYIHNNPLKE